MRAIAQAEEFEAPIAVVRSVESLDWTQQPNKMTLDDSQTLVTPSNSPRHGAKYNKPLISNLDAFSSDKV